MNGRMLLAISLEGTLQVPINHEETAYVISFYNVKNQAAKPVIFQLYNSFELLP